ncbi:MerR family transcriptional regulator [Priestia megaterium]|uniref:MerR family transcriptional regulator n=1 Tax=Priestia megaterium TaxID=1404 RepID=UPI00077D8E05|nr:MerR family transcriptional regulator [Priestia megaterium]
MSEQLGYFAKQVCEKLKLNPNTLRKWAIELEENGYKFERNNKGPNGQRIYYEHDINVISEFKVLVERTHSVENAAKLIMTRVKEGTNTEITHSVREEKERSKPVTVTFTREELEQYTRGVIEETSSKVATEVAAQTAEAVYKKMESLIEQRDHKLINQMNESMEQRRLETAAAQEEPASSFWSRLFNRK